jgi:hypothetical protein
MDDADIPKPFGDLLADIIEAGGSHPWDGGLSARLDLEGYTKAWRKRVVEQLREGAKRPVLG